MTLLDLFDAAWRDRGDAAAIGDVSYDDLHNGARVVAAYLAGLGLTAGKRISLFCENRLAFVYTYLAALRLGAIVVPTNVLYRAGDLGHVLRDADVSLVLVSEQTAEFVDALPDAPRRIDAREIETLATMREEIDVTADLPVVRADDVAAIIYTSGTTGRSKGAMLTHANLALIATQVTTAWRWTAQDTLAIALPLFHMHGLGAALNGSLAAGSHLLIDERFDAERMLETLRARSATMFFGVPTMYVRLIERIGSGEAPKLRLWVSGSAALAADVHVAFEERFGAQILERYGATEFGFPLSNRYAGPRVAGSVGAPMPGVSVRVAAAGSVDPLPPGEIGELLVSGGSVFAGYWNNPQATDAAFSIDPQGFRWYRSGDLAQYDAAADVYRIVGRLKELIITGGFNVYPREVEDEIDRFPSVRASAVVGIADSARGELPVAFVEAAGDFDAEALLAHLRANLASFKVPKTVHVIEALPRNALGKVEKPKLRALLAERG